MQYPYNAIFGRGLLNTFKAALHSAYLCLKVPALLGVISIHVNQKDIRNIEQGFTPGHRNVNCFQGEETEGHYNTRTSKSEASIITKSAIESECETKRDSLDPRVPDRTVMISQDLSPEEEIELFSFLDKNSDVFAWQTSNLTRVSRDIIEHRLQVNPSTKPRKQKVCKMFDKNIAAAKAEV
jgi:hypothetical protein